MFDDFMQNDFPEMHLNQIHQDAMLHAQNQAMQQAERVQQAADHRPPEPQPQTPEPLPSTVMKDAAMNWGLLLQHILAGLLGGMKK